MKSTLLVKILKAIKLCFAGFWAIPVVLLMRAIKPLIHIRLNTFSHLRIGEFVLHTGLYLGELKEKPENTVFLFWLPKGTCNNQWEKMTRRTLPNIYDWVGSIYLWNLVIPGGDVHFHPPRHGDQDKNGYFYKYNVKIPFLPEENKLCKEWLSDQGWNEGEQFVCLLVRDSAYLANDRLHGRGDSASYKRWDYHDYRDTEIDTYVKAMEWLADENVWVLRMGKIMSKPISSNHPRIIDYAFNPEKNDLLDIWLFANCTGCISTSTGIDSVSHMYGIPMLFVNQMSFRHLKTSHHSITVPKKHYWEKNNKKLKLKEIFLTNSTNSYTLENEGLKLVDLDEDEILLAVKEFWLRLTKKWHETSDNVRIQNQFWEWWRKNNPKLWDKTYHGWIHPEARVAADWLKDQNVDFFDDIIGFQKYLHDPRVK